MPLLILDTSLGSVNGPTLGATSLKTITYLGSLNDVRSLVMRGDLIRVGHPEQGETFRMSTDEGRVFDSQNVPLGTVEDPSSEGSLTTGSLVHGTYEVQVITIKAFENSMSLTPGSVLPSGFRIRFGTETTHGATSGGADCCLQLDGRLKLARFILPRYINHTINYSEK